ncbi:MAG: FHA domain-containing protein [Anaerolineae bacterium]|nr:FHA domain-containing protein [Anaerolineae bacterium]
MFEIVNAWYNGLDLGLVFFGVFIAAAVAIYIFFDASGHGDPSRVNVVKIVSFSAVILTLPSLYYRLFDPTAVAAGLIAYSIGVSTAISLWALLGMVGVILAVGVGIYYFVALRDSEVYMASPVDTQYSAPSTQMPPPPPPVPPVPPVQSPPSSPPQERVVSPTQPIYQEPAPTAWLIVRSAGRSGTQYGLSTKRNNTIGRDARQADFVLDDDTVSREHARVRYENGKFVVYDLASTSGTYVNDNMIQRQMLYDGDKITVGRIELVFKEA